MARGVDGGSPLHAILAVLLLRVLPVSSAMQAQLLRLLLLLVGVTLALLASVVLLAT